MKKIFIAGGAGMLVQAFYEVFKVNYDVVVTDIDLNESHIQYLDFRNYKDYYNAVIKEQPDYLFHLGAHTSLEFCEENIEDCYHTNTISVEYAVKIANELNIPLLFISTAGIFDGSKDFFTEYDTANPMGHYAKSKFYAEKIVCQSANNYLICRAGWMMGGGVKDKKFIGKLLKQVNDGKNELYIVNDKDGTPTFTFDFALNVKELVENDITGLFNMVCGGLTSRLEVANELLNLLGRTDIKVNTVHSDYFELKYFAPRPSNERLINFKLDILGYNKMRDWKVALKDYIKNYY